MGSIAALGGSAKREHVRPIVMSTFPPVPPGIEDCCPAIPPKVGEEDDLENCLDGYSAAQVFSQRKAITFDDLIALVSTLSL